MQMHRTITQKKSFKKYQKLNLKRKKLKKKRTERRKYAGVFIKNKLISRFKKKKKRNKKQKNATDRPETQINGKGTDCGTQMRQRNRHVLAQPEKN